MSDIELLILFKQAEAADHFNTRTGDCSGDCSEFIATYKDGQELRTNLRRDLQQQFPDEVV